MAEKSALAKELFFITSSVCVVLCVIPCLWIFMRMQQVLFGATTLFGFPTRQVYLEKGFWPDLTWLIVLGALAVTPPVLIYFKYARLSMATDTDPDNS